MTEAELARWLREDLQGIRDTLDGLDARLRDIERGQVALQASLPQDLDRRLRLLEAWRAKVVAVAGSVAAVTAVLMQAVVQPVYDWLKGR